MKCIIECIRPLSNKFEIITLKDGKIYFDDGRYERIILDKGSDVEQIYLNLCKIVFSWKQEYIGDRVYGGEKYLIEFEVNHKRKKYKIHNKFPDNWEEFICIKNKILDYDAG